MPRTLKRVIIIIVYLMLASSIGIIIWQAVAVPPSCTDGKQNQGEKDVDCGGVCGACPEVIRADDLAIISTNLVYGGLDRYDVIAQIKNPNSLYGARSFTYVFILKGSDGQEIARAEGVAYSLPSQTRYIAEIGIQTQAVPATMDVQILPGVDWVRFTDFQDPDFIVDSSNFGTIEEGVGYAKAEGLVRNRSNFEFQDVGLIIILKNPEGRPIAINKTRIQDFQAQQIRDFNLTWPSSFPGTIDALEIEIEANIYDQENFIRQFVPDSQSNPFL